MASKIIPLRYKDTCSVCGVELPPKTRANYDTDTKRVTCLDCGAANDETAVPPATPPVSADPLPPYRLTPASGQAGASAAREYERRHRKREQSIDRRFGRFAGVVKFLVDDPQSTRAWAKGSAGERQLAEALTRRLGDRAVLLHDRKIPRSSANIDHLAIASSGVWIIDAKKYSGKLERRDKGGWFRTDFRVYVGGRDRTRLVEGLHKQESVVRAALADPAVPIHKALCFVDAEWGLFSSAFQLEGVWVIYGKKLAELISEPGPLSNDDVLRVANALAEKLPTKET
jgi:hypothetical protein